MMMIPNWKKPFGLYSIRQENVSLTTTYMLDFSTGHGLAVSSSPRPWIDLFALPEKFNKAVIESDPEPNVRKISIIF